MNNCIYTPKNFNISIHVKIHNFFSGFFSRKDLLKDFCNKNGIDYKPKKHHKYKMPESYLIHHSELVYLGGIRDKIILLFYAEYKNLQIENINECKNLETKIANLKEIIAEDKTRLTEKKHRLSTTKDPLARIHLKDIIETLKTRITNEKNDLSELESDFKKHHLAIESNILNWEKQVDIIENIFATRKGYFNKNIGRKITRTLNFTSFDSQFPDYSDSVKKILKGGYYEK